MAAKEREDFSRVANCAFVAATVSVSNNQTKQSFFLISPKVFIVIYKHQP